MAGEPSRRRPDHRRVRVGQELGRRGDRLPARAARERFALLDLDYLSWAGPDTGDRAAEIELLSQNLAAIVPNYQRIGVTLFVLAYFVRGAAELQAISKAMSVPLKVVRLAVPLAVIELRLAGDVTSGRRDDLREAAEQLATAEGVGLEDVTIVSDRPVDVVAQEMMTFLGWS